MSAMDFVVFFSFYMLKRNRNDKGEQDVSSGKKKRGVTLDKLQGDGYCRAGQDYNEEGYILYTYSIYIYIQYKNIYTFTDIYTYIYTVCIYYIGKCTGIKLADPRGL